MATMLALIDPGDEVVVFEPFYENYGPDAILSGATPRFVHAARAGLALRPGRAGRRVQRRRPRRSSSTRRTIRPARCSRAHELETIADALPEVGRARDHGRDLRAHHLRRRASTSRSRRLPGMAERTVTINGLSKTYSVTGWRVGWTISPPSLTGAIRKVHDFLTVGAPAPLQEAGAVGAGAAGPVLRRPGGEVHAAPRRAARQPRAAPLHVLPPVRRVLHHDGHRRLRVRDDVEFARYLVKDVGVAAVPGSSFYKNAEKGRTKLRFCFCKKDETLRRGRPAAGEGRAAPGRSGPQRRSRGRSPSR